MTTSGGNILISNTPLAEIGTTIWSSVIKWIISVLNQFGFLNFLGSKDLTVRD